MSVTEALQKSRKWFPVPQSNGRPNVGRWVLLDGNRHAVSVALLLAVYVTIMVSGQIWTFQLQRLLTETNAVQTVFNTLLSGIILLVSIVVSINSIVLSHDITSVEAQEERIEGVMEFRRDLGRLSNTERSPSDPSSFLSVMSEVISERVESLTETAGDVEEELPDELDEYVSAINDTVERLGGSFGSAGGAEFGVLWIGLETDYGPYVERSRTIRSSHAGQLPESFEEQLDELVRAFQLFAIGKEYFKTLYYSREVSELSRTLLLIAIPSILINAISILAINAELFPGGWILGMPPLLSFVAAVFTISLAPYIILTAYMLRLATVTRRTATAGPFSLGT
jgi:hypothetical protein